MERLLVGMDARQGAWEAWNRAVSLSRRIDATVYALLVIPPSGPAAGQAEQDLIAAVRKRLDLLVEAAKADGVKVALYVTEGLYESEVIRFAREHRITLLVAEHDGTEARGGGREAAAIRKIRHLINCPVELVSPRRDTHPLGDKDKHP